MADEYSADTSIEDIKVAIRRSFNNPNIGQTFHSVIKEGPRTFKIATIFEILDSNTNEHHHFALRLDTVDRLKSGWKSRPRNSLWLHGNDGELERLLAFLNGTLQSIVPDEIGNFVLVDEGAYLDTKKLADLVLNSDSPTKSHLVRQILEDISKTESIPEYLPEAFQAGSIQLLESISTSARIVQYARILEEFSEMVDTSSVNEPTIQHLLQENPWLFGSEYSELLDRRNWTRDDDLDFMLRRTVDGYLEIIEIKTPFEQPLFNFDRSHNNYYPAAPLSKAIGQVLRYIEEIQRDRDRIMAVDGIDPLKVRARIIIGKDGNEEQNKALRNLNAHLVQIEILTFDQLIRIGRRVLSVFEDILNLEDFESSHEPESSDMLNEDELPF
jgi:hypothetical protein